jgi:glucans biosynthesis protein
LVQAAVQTFAVLLRCIDPPIGRSFTFLKTLLADIGTTFNKAGAAYAQLLVRVHSGLATHSMVKTARCLGFARSRSGAGAVSGVGGVGTDGRVGAVVGCAAWAVAVCLSALSPARAFGFDDVAEQARQLALQPHRVSPFVLPADLKALSYDQYRDIRFRPERALWGADGLPFEVMFFHLGKYQTEPVQIHEITPQGAVRPLGFDRNDFDYGRNALLPQQGDTLGHAGLRVHHALNRPDHRDELIVFLGASYFRALGAHQRFGLSARGLAIDTVGGQGEEFPRFTAFWLEQPTPGAASLVMHALLESPRVVGAYRFDVTPGAQTTVDVRTRLYLRKPVATLGLAPLTSMFQFGENQPNRDDFRPEVHDSDGLMVATGDGEWLWRSLQNPRQQLTTSFAMRSLRGFGLMQRDRSFASYEDTEARYDLRPSAWITPQSDWGPGRVELMQFSTPDETHDNVVAYWVPDHLPAPGEPLDIAYRLHWQGSPGVPESAQQRPPGAWVTQSRAGRGFEALAPGVHQYIVDFAGPSIAALPASAAVRAVVTADGNGRIVHSNAYRNDATGGWRMSLQVQQHQILEPVELRAFLQLGTDTLSETWSYVIPPR